MIISIFLSFIYSPFKTCGPLDLCIFFLDQIHFRKKHKQVGMNIWSSSSLACYTSSWGIQTPEQPSRSGLPPVLWGTHKRAKIRHPNILILSQYSLHPTSHYCRQLHSYSKDSFYKLLNCISCCPESPSEESSQEALLQNNATKEAWGKEEQNTLRNTLETGSEYQSVGYRKKQKLSLPFSVQTI